MKKIPISLLFLTNLGKKSPTSISGSSSPSKYAEIY